MCNIVETRLRVYAVWAWRIVCCVVDVVVQVKEAGKELFPSPMREVLLGLTWLTACND